MQTIRRNVEYAKQISLLMSQTVISCLLVILLLQASPVATEGLWWAHPFQKNSRLPNGNTKYCKSGDLSNFWTSSPPE